jgi:hydroxyacylglutathione hydrolase
MPRIPILSQTDYDSQHLSTRGATSEHRAGEAGRTEAVGPAQPGALRGGIATWLESGREQAHVPQVSVREVQTAMANPDSITVLDVRNPGEWKRCHIAGAIHISGGGLPKQFEDVPTDKPLYIISGSGYRSSGAASVLAHHGHVQIANVNGGMTAWRNQSLLVVEA